jgi:transcription antitermination factor NusG
VDYSPKDLGTEPRWFAFQVQPQMLKTADFNLKNQNFDPFFPTVSLGRGKRLRIEPMFKGYGFVLFDPSKDRWQSVNGTKGVVGLLPRSSVYPTPVPKGFVERLKEADPTPENRFLEVFESYFPGVTEVVIAEDHSLLGGRVGLVVDVRSKMLQVSFSVNGLSVWVDRDDAIPISGSSSSVRR